MRIPVWVQDSELGGGTQRHEDFRTWDRAALLSGASLGLQGGRERQAEAAGMLNVCL